MNGGVMLAAAAAAIVVAGAAGCSHDKPASSSPAPASPETSAPAQVSTGASTAKVLIDGKARDVTGTVVCTAAAEQINIAIGGSGTGIGAVLTDADPPGVTSVALGDVDGMTLGYTQGTGEGSATATKDGNNYKIKGNATGVDIKNPMQVLEKPFEIDVTCP